MARKRMIDPDFWIDEEIAQLPFEGRLLYIGLWNFADDQGVLPYKPNQIRAQVFPYDPEVDVQSLLKSLIDMGKLIIYEVENVAYLHIRNFMRHQSVKKPACKYPAPPNNGTSTEPVPHQFPTGTEPVRNQYGTSSPPVPHRYGTSTEPVRNQFPLKEKKRIEEKRKEEKGKEEGTTHEREGVKPHSNENAPDASNIPPSLSHALSNPLGYSPTDDSKERAWKAIREIESIFGATPFTAAQIGDGRKDRMLEELSSICRLLSPEEISAIVRHQYEQRIRESKGVDRPTNLAYYMPALKEAFFARNRELEEAERKRDEEKRKQARASPEEPIPLGEILGRNMTEAERKQVAERIRQTKERIKASG